jgi:hypothetical protein
VTGFRKRTADGAEEALARKALERTVRMLMQYQRAGLTMVAIEDVLSLLGAGDSGTVPEVTPRDPRADPLTHCLPVTPAGH